MKKKKQHADFLGQMVKEFMGSNRYMRPTCLHPCASTGS